MCSGIKDVRIEDSGEQIETVEVINSTITLNGVLRTVKSFPEFSKQVQLKQTTVFLTVPGVSCRLYKFNYSQPVI